MMMETLRRRARRQRNTPLVGLELTTQHLALVALETPHAGSEQVLCHAYRSWAEARPESAVEALRGTWQRLDVLPRRVALSVPAHCARYTVISGSPQQHGRQQLEAQASALLTLDATQIAWHALPLPNLADGTPCMLLAAMPLSELETSLTLLQQAQLEVEQVQIDALALLTACVQTPAWRQAAQDTHAIIHLTHNALRWFAHTPDTPLPLHAQSAPHSEALLPALEALHPDWIFLAGPAPEVRDLMQTLHVAMPHVRLCSNPFAAMSLRDEQQRRPLTTQACGLFVALGLALGIA